MKQLLMFINSFYPLTEAATAHLQQILKKREVPKKQFILKAGHVSQEIPLLSPDCFVVFILTIKQK